MAENYGHMTMIDGTHVPLTKDDAAAIWKSVLDAKAARAETLPTAKDALNAMSQAETRLRELGWAPAGGLRVKRGDECAVMQPGASTGMWSGHLDADGDFVHFGDCVSDPRKVWLKPLPDLTPDEKAHMDHCDQREAEAYNAMLVRL